MPKLVMNNGTFKIITMEKALVIHSLLMGKTSPESPKQVAFLKTVAEVDFDEQSNSLPLTYEPAKLITVNDPELKQVLEDKSLKGKDKARAVAERIRQKWNDKTDGES